ncbi:MAG: hypothetical protein Q7T40_12215 [Methylobacter sp.]|nr:hypothetical protein [Methylobacter sp.]
MKNEENQDNANKSIYRKPGILKGKIEMPDEFYDPMSEEELALWHDAPIFPDDETHTDQAGGFPFKAEQA